MAKFTSTADLKIKWNGLEMVGTAGTEFRIPDAFQDEFDGAFSQIIPGLSWVTTDEIADLDGRIDDLEGAVGLNASSTVSAAVTYGISTSAGTATEYSRGDHRHGSVPLPTQSGAGFTVPSGSLVISPASVTVSSSGIAVGGGNPVVLGGDVKLYRVLGETLRIETAAGSAATVQIKGNFNVRGNGDGAARVETNTGISGLQFGNGTDALDTNLYRSAADTLKTDDALNVVGNMLAGKIGVMAGSSKFFQTGQVQVNMGGAATGTQAVSFTPAFDNTPVVILTRITSTGTSPKVQMFISGDPTTAGFTAGAATGDGTTSGNTITARWIAFDPTKFF